MYLWNIVYRAFPCIISFIVSLWNRCHRFLQLGKLPLKKVKSLPKVTHRVRQPGLQPRPSDSRSAWGFSRNVPPGKPLNLSASKSFLLSNKDFLEERLCEFPSGFKMWFWDLIISCLNDRNKHQISQQIPVASWLRASVVCSEDPQVNWGAGSALGHTPWRFC